ncbi:MAG: phosphatase PAP2 family protein [Methyloceanibacter sp.]|jgi:membrane-associated phospholipid phosphatase|nr:phosphatase PAP2 family protein [Methyloceanibacter sp.]
MILRLKNFTIVEQVVLALSLVLLGFLLFDPFMLERARVLDPEARTAFKAVTNIGRSNWMLIPTGAAIALALVLRRRHVGFRNAAGYGLIASTIGFVFVSVGGAGLVATLTKNILGRARPKLFDTMGPFEFKLFAFSPDYASLPSGHATNIFAFATVIAMLWPRGKVLLYTVAFWIAASRVLIGEHYFTDAVLGAILGTVVPYFVRDRFAARRWLFERTPDGGYKIRGARTQRWLGWPKPAASSFGNTQLFGTSSGKSEAMGGD